jgi:hypothetical protein
VLDETLARPGVLVGRTPWLQLLLMRPDQFESALGIRGIILLTTWREGCATRGQHARMNRVKDHVIIRQERIEQAAFRWLQADGNVATRKSRRQRSGPGVNRFRQMPDHAVCFLVSTGRPSTTIVLRVGPVDAHQGGRACVIGHRVVPQSIHFWPPEHAGCIAAKALSSSPQRHRI